MTDYIKREDAVELAKDSQADLALEGDKQSFVEELENIPSADVAPVVRCGDCLFCQMELFEGADEPWCDVHSTMVDAEAFCSWGIRKDDE